MRPSSTSKASKFARAPARAAPSARPAALRLVALFLVLFAGPQSLKQAAAQSSGREASVQVLAAQLTTWVADDTPSAHARALDRVRRGVPPGALAAFLAAARTHPDPRYLAIIERATRYRSVMVRGRALAAWAAHGRSQADLAIARAADDHDPLIRRLAWALSNMHPSPTGHEIIEALLERDDALARAVGRETKSRR